jgi:hypothetical protein
MKLRVCIAALALSLAAFAQDEKVGKPDSQPASDTKTTPDATKTKATSAAPGTPAEMKTQTYKGILVDTSCGAPSNTASSDSSAPANSSQASADRAAGPGCTLSANSSQLGLKMKDGHTVHFDMVGNQRAQDALKNKKKWTEAATAGKEIRVTVKGALNGDKLIVSSID